MQTGMRLCTICLLLLLSLLAAGHALTQDADPTPEPKTPLPVPESPVVTLDSNVVTRDGVDVETGSFVITSSNTSQFNNAESVEWVAANESTRDVEEATIAPSAAGTIRVSAEDLGYKDGDIISFSLTSLAALDDEDYSDSPSLIFCYPVHEACRDPRTLVRSLPPPLDATVTLVTPEPPEDGDAQAQASDEGGTFTVTIPKKGTVIENAEGYNWKADNSDGNSASGNESLNGNQAQAQVQAQAVDPTETIRFGADLIDFQTDEVVRITLRTVAPTNSIRYVDSHPVVYYYCSVPNVNCADLWRPGTPGGNGDDDDDDDDNGGGGSGAGENCLNTDEGAPIKVCVNTGGTSYTLYGVYQDSTTTSLSIVSSAATLYNADTPANDNLASGTNGAANKTYTVSYDGKGVMTLSTYYADKGPDVDKPYIITIDTHDTVRYVQW